MAYYEKIFQDLGVDESSPGALIMTTIVNTIYSEMNTMRVECKKSLDDAWELVQKCMNPTIRYIRLMSYYKYMTILLDAHQYFGYFSDTLRVCAKLKWANIGTNYWDSPLDNTAIQFMQKHYNSLYEEARKADVDCMNAAIEGKPASESVVTDCSPIAPYIGTIRTPFPDIIKTFQEPDEADGEDEAAVEGHIIFNDENVKRKALWRFILIFNDAERFESILNFEQEIKEMYLNHGKYFVREMHHVYPIGVTEFITYSNLVANPDMFPQAMKFMLVDQDYQYKFGSDGAECSPRQPLRDAMEAYSELLDVAGYTTEEELTADTNRILAHARRVLENSVKKADEPAPNRDVEFDNVIVPGDKLSTFNLNHLMNFIYTSRRYISDQYTVTSFMSRMAVKTVSYVKNFILIEPDLGTKPSEYIYVPVIDTLNGRKACVIRYQRETEAIDVLTVQQYEDSVREVTQPEPPDGVPTPDSETDDQYTDPAAGT